MIVIAACDAKPSGPTMTSPQHESNQRPPVPNDALEQLLRAVETMAADDALYLDEVGWFRIRRYEAYEGKNPRTGERVYVPAKALVMFEADGNLLNSLNGRAREDLGDPTTSNGDNVIHRYDWARSMASRAHRDLVTNGNTIIAGFGALRVERRMVEYDGGARRVEENRVFWEMSEALRQRLDRQSDRSGRD